jgi:membrane protease subunit (stomatin/prohibitin family)
MNQPELFAAEAPPDEPLNFDVLLEPRRVAFTVRLMDYPHSTADVVRVSESRFLREIERQLGDEVVPALRAYQNAYESSGVDLTKDELALAQRWAKAYDVARTAGFRDLGDTDEAFFEVKPV